jgi:hypothetical protein
MALARPPAIGAPGLPKRPADVVSGYLDIWRRILEATDFKAGCALTGAQERATLLVCAAEGAVLLARAQRSTEPANGTSSTHERCLRSLGVYTVWLDSWDEMPDLLNRINPTMPTGH